MGDASDFINEPGISFAERSRRKQVLFAKLYSSPHGSADLGRLSERDPREQKFPSTPDIIRSTNPEHNMSTTTKTVTDLYGHEHALPGPFKTVAEIKQANREAGQHFFSPDTLRFFRSRIESDVLGGRLFITSEQFVASTGEADPRRYTVRVANDDASSINTVHGFQEFDSLEEAHEAIVELLA